MTEFDQIHVGVEPSQIDVITSTLILLRKIRGFPQSLYVDDPAYTSVQHRQFLLDAELVGSVCARFLIVPPDKPVTEERDGWLSMMAELSSKYFSFPEIQRSSLSEATHRVVSSLGLLHALTPTISNPDTQMEFQKHLLSDNGNDLSFQDLLDHRLAILSPLATDYLTACLLRRFVTTYLTPNCFILKPIILDRYLEPAVMPDFDENQSWMVGINRGGVFVENSTSYDTQRATWRAVRKLCPMPGMD